MKRVAKFRPPRGFFGKEFLRYDGGKWSPDDGERDLAFYGLSEDLFPMVLGFDDYDFEERDSHPNGRAYESAMDACSSRFKCANGRTLKSEKGYFKAGKVRYEPR